MSGRTYDTGTPYVVIFRDVVVDELMRRWAAGRPGWPPAPADVDAQLVGRRYAQLADADQVRAWRTG